MRQCGEMVEDPTSPAGVMRQCEDGIQVHPWLIPRTSALMIGRVPGPILSFESADESIVDTMDGRVMEGPTGPAGVMLAVESWDTQVIPSYWSLAERFRVDDWWER